MDENVIVGGAKSLAGRVESAAGALIGDNATELGGKIRDASGVAQQRYGEAADAIRQVTSNAPLTALLTAGSIGLIIGLFLNRR